MYECAGNFLDVAVGEGYNAVYEFNFTLFCSTFSLPPVPTLSALNILTRAGYIEYIEETTSRSRVMVIMRRDALYDLRLDPVVEDVMQCLLRAYTGLFADYVYISELLIAERLRLSSEQVYQALLTLSRLHVLHYVPRATTPYLVYTTSREEPRHLIIPLEVYERQRERMEQRVNAMKEFTFNATTCRANTLLRYFGESPAEPCGKCDVCRANRKAEARKAMPDGMDTRSGIDLERSILYQASHPGGTDLKKLIANLTPTFSSEEVISTVRALADNGHLTLSGIRISKTQR